MAELALGISIVALIVALTALGAARATRTNTGPRPNVLTSLVEPREAAAPVEGFGLPAGRASGPEMAEVRSLLAQGNKIGAIKQYRIQTGVGLKEAKDAVEAMERGQA